MSHDTTPAAPASGSKKTIADLRETLFETLAAVRTGALPLDQARAINEISKTIVDTAKVEVEYLRTTGDDAASSFIAAESPPELPDGITRSVVHRLR